VPNQDVSPLGPKGLLPHSMRFCEFRQTRLVFRYRFSVDEGRQHFAELINFRAVAPDGDGQRAEQDMARLGSDPKFGKAAPSGPGGGENKLTADEGER
jgi:hypothetical protein